MQKIKTILLSTILLSTFVSAHTLTLVAHKNDNSLSSGTKVCRQKLTNAVAIKTTPTQPHTGRLPEAVAITSAIPTISLKNLSVVPIFLFITILVLF